MRIEDLSGTAGAETVETIVDDCVRRLAAPDGEARRRAIAMVSGSLARIPAAYRVVMHGLQRLVWLLSWILCLRPPRKLSADERSRFVRRTRWVPGIGSYYRLVRIIGVIGYYDTPPDARQ